jgi:hypothetical protein
MISYNKFAFLVFLVIIFISKLQIMKKLKRNNSINLEKKNPKEV